MENKIDKELESENSILQKKVAELEKGMQVIMKEAGIYDPYDESKTKDPVRNIDLVPVDVGNKQIYCPIVKRKDFIFNYDPQGRKELSMIMVMDVLLPDDKIQEVRMNSREYPRIRKKEKMTVIKRTHKDIYKDDGIIETKKTLKGKNGDKYLSNKGSGIKIAAKSKGTQTTTTFERPNGQTFKLTEGQL